MSPPQIGSEKERKWGDQLTSAQPSSVHHDPTPHSAHLLQTPLLGAEGVQEAAGPHSWKLLP